MPTTAADLGLAPPQTQPTAPTKTTLESLGLKPPAQVPQEPDLASRVWNWYKGLGEDARNTVKELGADPKQLNTMPGVRAWTAKHLDPKSPDYNATMEQAINLAVGAPKLGEVPKPPEATPRPPETPTAPAPADIPPTPTTPPARAAEAPGPILDLPKEGETTKGTQTRIDDALYRTRKAATADKIEASQFLRGLSKEVTNPQTQEGLYHSIEQRLVDPKAETPEPLRAAEEALKPWKEEEHRLYTEIKGKGLPEPAIEEPTPGYVHRVVKGRGTYFDQTDPGANADPVLGTRSLSKRASSLQPRKFWVLESPEGQRVMAREVPKDVKPGLQRRADDGRLYTYQPATTREIEAMPGGPQYYKNALVNTVDNVLRLRRVKRNIDLLDQLKPQLESKGLWQARQAKDIPPGWERVHLTQLEGWADPRIAHVLNDFAGDLSSPSSLAAGLTKINRFVTGSLFFTPIPHAANVLNHWIVGRGFDWMRPSAWMTLSKTAARAARAVITQDADYVRMLREGSGLLYGDVAQQNFYKLMLQKLGAEMTHDPQTFKATMKELGTSEFWKTPADFLKMWYRTSSKALWAVSDMFMLQRQFELMQKGMSSRAAIAEAEKDIPNYRVPSEIMGSRAASQFLQNPNIMMFGRYRYGQLRAYGEMIRDLLKGTPHDKKEAAGKALTLLVLGGVAYPLADAAIKNVTGNKNASAQRFGPMSPVSAIQDLTDGQREWVAAMSSLIVPAPATVGFMEALWNRDMFGRPVINPQSNPLSAGVQAGEFAASKIAPLQQGMAAMKPGGAAQQAARMFGIKIPPPGQERGRAVGKMIERRAANKRDRKDPIYQFIQKHLGQ